MAVSGLNQRQKPFNSGIIKKMIVSINPTYNCNLRCNFCYLTHTQLGSPQRAPLAAIKERLDEISKQYQGIEHFDIYGGEISLLDAEYFNSLLSLLEQYCDPPFNIVTNLTQMPIFFGDARLYISVSYDFHARALHEEVFSNMLSLERPFSILTLASPEVLKLNVDQAIDQLNILAKLESLEIKPYSKNQANQLELLDSEYEEFIKKWISSTHQKNFTFINEEKIKESLALEYNAFSDDHVYITPNGKLAVLEFDDQNNEYFKELKSISEYQQWTKAEKAKIMSNDFCSQCRFLGNCLTEHYREVESLENSCNGFKHLLEWYDENCK